MPAITTAIASELASGAEDVMQQAAAVVTGNQGSYIKDGEPGSIYGKVQQATARQACRRYADDPGQFSGRFAVVAENICRPYLDDIGYGSPPQIKLPFRGGQCAEKYRVNLSSPDNSGGFNDFTVLTYGPVSGLDFEAGPSGSERWYLLSGGPVVFGGQCFNIVDPAPGTRTFLGSYTPLAGESGRINSVIPCASDNCGSPPPEIVAPVPPPVPGPTVEPFNPSPDIDIDIGVEINPDLTIDVDFGTGPITIDPFGDGGDGGDGGGGGGGPGGPGSPGSPVGTGAGGEADGEADPGQVLTGLLIDFVEPPIGGNEYAPGVFRGVCYIYMGTPEGLDHDPAGAMLRDGQFVYAEKDYLTRWTVRANLGYNLRVTPYYRPSEAEV